MQTLQLTTINAEAKKLSNWLQEKVKTQLPFDIDCDTILWTPDILRKELWNKFSGDEFNLDDITMPTELNPHYNDYEFYKVFDSFTAFQEIQMFMGGVLGSGEKEIVEVADKYKIGQHGFDKWSFRREPDKKS